MSSPIPTVPFAQAKDNFSGFMSRVVREHLPQSVERSCGQESMLVLPLGDMFAALGACRLDAKVTFGKRSVVGTLPRFGLVANGETFEGAMQALLEELTEYAEDFFTDLDFYRHTDRMKDLPWLLSFVLTPTADRAALLVEEAVTPTPEVAVARVG